MGGVVRDLALDSFSESDDIDLTTDAIPPVIKALVGPMATAVWTQGERYGTIGATINGRDLEITTHRSEAYDPGSRKPRVAFGQSIDDDLSRRDFTINAMAILLPDGDLVDPFGGLDHLTDRLLATPLSATESFSDDPLRMLRAARFLPRFGLEPEAGLEAAARTLSRRLAIVSVERVQVELERFLALPELRAGLEFLRRCELIVEVIPAYRDRTEELAAAVSLASSTGSVVVRRAGLSAPLGESLAVEALSRLRYSRNITGQTVRLIQALPLATSRTTKAESVRRVVDGVGLAAMEELRQLADNVTAHGVETQATGGQASDQEQSFFVCYDELAAAEDLADLNPALSGLEIMDRLGIKPGRMVGEATEQLRQWRLERGPLAKDQALDLLEGWWNDSRNQGD